MSAAPQITIESITGVDIELRIAGAGSRSYAFIIDWHIRLILAFAWWIAGTALMTGDILAAIRGQAEFGDQYALLVVLPMLGIYFLYHPILEPLMRGRTPGKRMAGVRVVTRRGDIPGFGALLLRNLFRIVDSLPVFYLLGLVTVMFTDNHVRIGDLAAGTLLVIDNTTNEKAFKRVTGATRGQRLDPQSADLVEELLDRWAVLDATTRTNIAQQLLIKLDPALTPNQLATSNPEELRAQLQALLQA